MTDDTNEGGVESEFVTPRADQENEGQKVTEQRPQQSDDSDDSDEDTEAEADR